MSHLPFIVGAYFVTLVGTACLAFWSLTAMRRAEREAARLDK